MKPRRVLVRLRGAVLLQQETGGLGRQEHLSPGHHLDGLDEVGVGAGLGQVAAGPRLHHRNEVLLLGVHREHQDAGVQAQGGDPAGRLQSVGLGHGEVHDDHVGLEGPDLVHRLVSG